MDYTGRQNNHDVEQGGHQYELSTSPESMTTILNKRRQIEEELVINRTKREQQLLPAQQALLDSNSATEDYQARVRLDSVETEITNSFRRIRDLVNELKQMPNQTDPRMKAQRDFISGKVQGEIQDYYKSQRDIDQRLRAQVRRRYELTCPDATPEQVDAGVQGVILGQDQIFQITGARTRQARDTQTAVKERSAAIRRIEQDLITLSELSQEIAALVEQQEDAIKDVEQHAQTTFKNYEKGNSLLSRAIISTRNARRYKWYILLVCFLIIVIVVVASLVVCKVTNHC